MNKRSLQYLIRDFALGIMLTISLLCAISYVFLGSIHNGIKLLRGFYLIRQNYIKTPDSNRMIDGALEGMTNSLGDPYSYYLDSSHYEKFLHTVEGNHVGIGILVTKKNAKVKIEKVFTEGSGKMEGLLPGEFIRAVDGIDVDNMDLPKVVDLITGPEETTLVLRVENNQGEIRSVKLKRRRFVVPSVQYRMIESRIGYIQLSQFSDNTSIEVEQALKDFRFHGVNKLVIDLRGNPGGSLVSVEAVANLLLPKGELMHIVERNGETKTIHINGTKEPIFMAVLVDQQTASASEIFAGMVQDKKMGILIGEKTHGKGTVQAILPLSTTEGIRITVAEYYSTNHRSINGIGLTPDIQIEKESLNERDILSLAIAELKKH